MLELLNSFVYNSNTPFLIAFFLGILMSISPCPLASNIAAIAYISKQTNHIKQTLLNGMFYTIGRMIGYTAIASLIYFGLSEFHISNFLQSYISKLLGPILIIIALILLGVIKINTRKSVIFKKIDKIQEKLARQKYIGPGVMGILFSLAFCPYSAVLFFAILIPLILSSSEGLLLTPVFAIGSGLPVIIFSFIIVFSFKKLSKIFKIVKKGEHILRRLLALTILAIGLYYTYLLINS